MDQQHDRQIFQSKRLTSLGFGSALHKIIVELDSEDCDHKHCIDPKNKCLKDIYILYRTINHNFRNL